MVISKPNRDFIDSLLEYYISEAKSYRQIAENYVPDVESVADTAFGIITGCVYSGFLQAYQNQQQSPGLDDMQEFNRIIKKNAPLIKGAITGSVPDAQEDDDDDEDKKAVHEDDNDDTSGVDGADVGDLQGDKDAGHRGDEDDCSADSDRVYASDGNDAAEKDPSQHLFNDDEGQGNNDDYECKKASHNDKNDDNSGDMDYATTRDDGNDDDMMEAMSDASQKD